MSFKRKLMRMRQALSEERTANQHRKPGTTATGGDEVPRWSELVKMGADEVATLLAAHKLTTTGNLMKDKSALNKAR